MNGTFKKWTAVGWRSFFYYYIFTKIYQVQEIPTSSSLYFLTFLQNRVFLFSQKCQGKSSNPFYFHPPLVSQGRQNGLYDCYFRRRIIAFIWPSPSLTFFWNDVAHRRCAFFSSLYCRLAGADPACGCTSSAYN